MTSPSDKKATQAIKKASQERKCISSVCRKKFKSIEGRRYCPACTKVIKKKQEARFEW